MLYYVGKMMNATEESREGGCGKTDLRGKESHQQKPQGEDDT